MGWGALIACYCLQGVGRAVWESTSRAVWADYFPKDAATAFAAHIFQFGAASTFGFIVFPQLADQLVTLALCAVASIISLAASVVATLWKHYQPRKQPSDELSSAETTSDADVLLHVRKASQRRLAHTPSGSMRQESLRSSGVFAVAAISH
jgi:MFS family permease